MTRCSKLSARGSSRQAALKSETEVLAIRPKLKTDLETLECTNKTDKYASIQHAIVLT